MTGAPAPVDRAPRRIGLLVVHVRAEINGARRSAPYVIGLVVVPAVLYIMFGLPNDATWVEGGSPYSTIAIGSFTCYGAVSLAIFTSVDELAKERASGWMTTMQATPIPLWSQLLAKLSMAGLYALAIVALLAAVSVPTGASRLGIGAWLTIAALGVLGVAMVGTIGAVVAFVVRPGAATAIANLVFLPVSFCSGFFFPLSEVHDVVRGVAPWLPTYHLGRLVWPATATDTEIDAFTGLPAEPLWVHVAWVVGAAVAGAAACYAVLHRTRGGRRSLVLVGHGDEPRSSRRPRPGGMRVLPVTLLLVAITGCGDDRAPVGVDEHVTTSTAGATAVQGTAAHREPACESGMLEGRTFTLCTAGDQPDQMLVLALHGRGSSPEDLRAMTGLDQAADGLAVVFPGAVDGGWGDDTFTTPARPRGDEDVAFLDALVDELRTDPRIADSPVGIAGFSNGASMALRYAAERPDDVRAVVAVAGQLPRDPAIRPREPVPLLLVYGTADPIRSHDAGVLSHADRQPGGPTPTLSTSETVNAFVSVMTSVTHEGPSETDPDPTDGTRLRTERWLGADESIVVLHTVVDGGHTWPSARSPVRRDFGPTSQDLDATAAAMTFFLEPRAVASSSTDNDDTVPPSATSPPTR